MLPPPTFGLFEKPGGNFKIWGDSPHPPRLLNPESYKSNREADTADIRKTLDNMRGTTYLHLVPGYSKIPGNELADIAAKDATKIEGIPTAVSFSSVRSVIND